MQKLLHFLPFVIALVLCAASAFVAWKMGKRWNVGLKEAREYRAHLEGEAAAAAQLRAQLAQTQVVNANPQINIGSRVLSELRDARRDSSALADPGTLCPLCTRSDCWLDCVEEVDRGSLNQLLARSMAIRGGAGARETMARAVGSALGDSAADFGQFVDYSEELEPGDVGP